jgi:hypothetical protein
MPGSKRFPAQLVYVSSCTVFFPRYGCSVAPADAEHHPEQAAQKSGALPYHDFHGVTSRTAYSLPEANDSDGDDDKRRYHYQRPRRHKTGQKYPDAEAYRSKRKYTVIPVHVDHQPTAYQFRSLPIIWHAAEFGVRPGIK